MTFNEREELVGFIMASGVTRRTAEKYIDAVMQRERNRCERQCVDERSAERIAQLGPLE